MAGQQIAVTGVLQIIQVKNFLSALALAHPSRHLGHELCIQGRTLSSQVIYPALDLSNAVCLHYALTAQHLTYAAVSGVVKLFFFVSPNPAMDKLFGELLPSKDIRALN